jgi:hypothetical protein
MKTRNVPLKCQNKIFDFISVFLVTVKIKFVLNIFVMETFFPKRIIFSKNVTFQF